MAWATPEHKPEEYNAAAKRLARMHFPVDDAEALDTLSIINNWRSSHAYPLNTFQITLRRKGRKVEKGVIVAQRSKRLDSIHRKLVDRPTMRLTQMQDVAGCRAVFSRLRSVYRLVQEYRSAQFGHKLRGEKDYISHPKPDGYRCYHLVYEYIGADKTVAYTGLRVEVQVRTQMQHNWATAVEAVGIFTKQALKSNRGDSDWLRFFSLMGSVIAAIEKTPGVPQTPSSRAGLVIELTALSKKLRVQESLQVYNSTIYTLGAAKDAKYFIIELDPQEFRINIRRYKAKQSSEANRDYTRLESQIPPNSPSQVVLVSAENILALRKAYPN